LFWHFSLGDKTENCSAPLLAVCWIVRVDFKAHRLRDGFSVSNALIYEIRPRKDRRGFDLISDQLP
jgi:hypothetical protein